MSSLSMQIFIAQMLKFKFGNYTSIIRPAYEEQEEQELINVSERPGLHEPEPQTSAQLPPDLFY